MSGVRRIRGGWRHGAVLAVALIVSLLVAAVAWAAKGELSFNQRVPQFDVANATGIASSPDGAYLYVSGGNQLTVLSRNATTGAFTYVETETDGVDDPTDAGAQVDGLQSVTGVAVSADGKNVYATGWQPDNAVAVFARDAATGKLSFLEREKDGVNDPTDPGGTVDFLFRAEGVAVAPDGNTVYAVSGDDAVVGFTRDPATGKLSYLEAEVDAVDDLSDAGGTVDGMVGAVGVVVAPDNEAVYVATETDDSLVAFARDTGTGRLSYLERERDGTNDAGDPGGTVDGLNGANAVTVSPGNNAVFATGRNDSAVAVFARDTATEKLSFLEFEKDGTDDTDPNDPGPAVTGMLTPRALSMSADAENLYVAGQNSDAVAVFRWFPGLSELVFFEAEKNGVNDGADAGGTVTGLHGPSAVTVTPDGKHVYAATAFDAGLAAFSRKPAAPLLGTLSFILSAPDLALPDPRGVAVSPDGKHVLLTTLSDESVRSFTRDPATGAVVLADTETQGIDDPGDAGGVAAGLDEPAAVAVSPDNAHVYVTDTSTYSISEFTLNPSTGELSYVESVIDPDPGGHTGAVDGLYEPWDVAVTPSGTGVYATANNEDAVSAFTRNPATGKLTFVEAEFDGVGGVDGMSGTEGLAISPDGANVYVAGRNEEKLAVFSRNPGSNALTFLEVEEDGVNDPTDAGGTVAGIDSGPDDAVVSPDGKQVYAIGSDSVGVFDRDATTGKLSFAEVEENGVDDPADAGGPVDGLSGDNALAMSADGGELYVSTFFGTLVTFARDRITGRLSFLEVEREGADDPTDAGGRALGLADIQSLAVAPDDRHLYGASDGDNSLTIFDREDDFVAPDTSITDGPAEGSTITTPTPAFTFGSNESPVTFACSIDGGTAAPCAATTPSLADGAHTLSAAAIDSEGNTDPTPATRSFTVDATAPNTVITAGPNGPTKTGPSFSFTSTEGGSHFECRMDAGAFAACSSPKAYASLDDGDHTFRVRALDTHGNADATPATRAFTLDTKVKDGKVTADKTQKQKGSKIKVKVDVEAGETATATGKGTIEVPKGHSKRKKKVYKLAEVSADLVAGSGKTLKLKPKKDKNKRRIADALKDKAKVKAKIDVTITDALGNELTESKTVKLKRKK